MVTGPSSRRAALAEINVTPLVDVMLVFADHLHDHGAHVAA